MSYSLQCVNGKRAYVVAYLFPFAIMARMDLINFCLVICRWSSPMATPFSTQVAMFDCWSPNTGIPIIGTP